MSWEVQKDEGWFNIMVARHDDGDDSIGDRRSSSLASTWSDENRLNMERWTVAGVALCRATGICKWGLAAMTKIAGQRMSAETKQQELWSMPEGARCPSQMQNTRKHENRGEAEP